MTKPDLKKRGDKLHARFHKGKNANQSVWLREQFEVMDEVFEEPNFDPAKIADALIRIEHVLDFLGD